MCDCSCKCDRQMRGITSQQMVQLAARAEMSMTNINDRNTNRILIENAIREAIQIVDAKLI